MKNFSPVNSEEKEFCRHIYDLTSKQSFYHRFTAFLTEREQHLAAYTAESAGADCSFWGGYDAAVRRMFSFPEAEPEDFPLEAVTFFFREKDKLTHRDFLGSLMSLGVRRDQVGDILVTDGAAVIFVSRTAAPLLGEIEKVGRVGVSQRSGICTDLPQQEFDEISVICASNRIDAVISAVCGLSREKAAALVKSGGAVINGVQCGSVSENIDEGDIFSVKGYGKYIFDSVGNPTKKGKNHIFVKKYK
ncbi:MAG: hypothetical protein J1F60_03545 [Oscillospiraceae bacterium]|nr:hypothetical protein [Oscillospiraceae bacterium]